MGMTIGESVPLGSFGPRTRWTWLSILRHGLLFVTGIVLYGVIYAAVSGELPMVAELLFVLGLATVWVGVPSAAVLALIAGRRAAVRPRVFRAVTAALLLLTLAPVAAAFWDVEPAVPLAFAGGQLAYALLLLPVPKK